MHVPAKLHSIHPKAAPGVGGCQYSISYEISQGVPLINLIF